MTRSLYVLRHGKSDWEATCGTDAERPLKRRGRRAARTIGRFLTHIGEPPDLVISSPAVRARTTAELAASAGTWTADIRIEPRLYESNPLRVLAILRELDESLGRVCLVGHQPTCSEVIALLCAGSPPSFPTAALARIDLVDPWSKSAAGDGTLQWLVTPRLVDPSAGPDDA